VKVGKWGGYGVNDPCWQRKEKKGTPVLRTLLTYEIITLQPCNLATLQLCCHCQPVLSPTLSHRAGGHGTRFLSCLSVLPCLDLPLPSTTIPLLPMESESGC